MAMLYPTYRDLIDAANKGIQEGEEKIVESRYSIVLATAKRARQIIDGAPVLSSKVDEKPLTEAVDELYTGKIQIEK